MSPCPQPMRFRKVTDLFVCLEPARLYFPNNAIQIAIDGPEGANAGPQEPGVWNTKDFRPYIRDPFAPSLCEDCFGVFLVGLEVITHGETPEGAGFTITFRPPGHPYDGSSYIGQVGEASVGNGIRSGMACWAPCINGQTEYMFKVQTTGDWPLHSSYACNLSIQQWVR